jgi:hypothetical protein
MADKKISQLVGASTPLAGTEVLPIVQSSTTVKVATNDLTVKNVRSNATTGILQIAGPAAAATRTMTVPDANFTVARTDAANSFSSDQTLSTGNLVVGTAGKGIDFSANSHAAGMTSELFNWYEEGTWTPVDQSGANLTLTVTSAAYTRIGNVVNFTFNITYPSTANANGAEVGGLPFTSKNIVNPGGAFTLYTNYGDAFFGVIVANGTSMTFYTRAAAQILNSGFSEKNFRCAGTSCI